MFRYLTAILLITSFAAQTFQQAVVVLGYYTYTASYAKTCENKAKPMMHCNGKCQMMKKLQEEEQRNQQAPERKLENKVEVVSSKSFFASLEVFPRIDIQHESRPFCFTRCINCFTVFHPPQV